MAEFETLEAKRIDFNQGGEFLELSINVAKDGTRETRYLRLARGYFDKEGNERYKRGGVTLPRDPAVLAALSEALKQVDLSKLGGPVTAGAPEPE
ncbi:MAG TPA: hypothetical protein VM889_14960 [Candidatus Thermoplasmatota archaeon]|nr:hypothetical protein [Candidatus Thermoplasmatota archaeon]